MEVDCSCGEKNHTITPSQWLASLRGDAWLPVKTTQDDEERIEKRQATKEGIENLFSQSEIDGLLASDPDGVTAFLLHFGFDELDLKVKLQSATSGKPEDVVRKEASVLVDIGGQLPYLVDMARHHMDALKSSIEKLKETLDREPLRNESKIIGENVERILRRFAREQGLRVIPIHRGGDFEFWQEGDEGWSGGVIEVGPYLAEVKFTSGTRAHLSTAQSIMAREKKDHYVVLVVENADGLRDCLKETMVEEEVPEDTMNNVLSHSHVIQGIDSKLGSIPDPDEVEPDINGYWVKKRLWGVMSGLPDWLRQTFGEG